MKKFNLKEINELIKRNDWNTISSEYKLPEWFLDKYKYKLNWWRIIEHQKLSEKQIEKYQSEDPFFWYWTSVYQNLSEKFIEKYKDKVNWHWISAYQNLSEKFIEKYQDKVDWGWIGFRQKLSEKFIIEYIDKLNIQVLLKNRQIKFTENLLKFLLFKTKDLDTSKLIIKKLRRIEK